jgi:tetratricopeptide (TPR) repeat protein
VTGKRIVLIVTSAITPVLVLLLAELVLTLSGSGNSLSVVRPCVVGGKAAYCDNQNFTSVVFPPGVTRPASPYAFSASKGRDTYRIFILGDSAAYGDPDPAYAFSRYLNLMLRHRFPGIQFEVVNTSITAVDSHVLLRMANDLSGYQPDLFIIYAGNNEVIGPYGPGTTLTAQIPSLAVIRASIALRATRIGQLFVRMTEKPRQFRGMEMFLDQQVPADSPALPRVYKYLGENLDGIIASARKAHADVLLSTIGTNLRDCPPFHSAHRSDLSDQLRQKWDAKMAAGKAEQAIGDYKDALEQYLAADAIDSQYAELQFRIAECMYELGEVENAKQRFVAARELDTLRFRADRGMNDAIRHAAMNAEKRGFHNVSLVDTAAILAKASPDGITGRELFFDHVHLRPHGNYLVAAAMFQQIVPMVERRLGNENPQYTVLSEEDCNRLLALTDYDMTRLAREMQRRLERPPFTSQMDNAEQIARFRQEAVEHTVSLQKSLDGYEWAIRNNPDDYLLRQNLGLLLYGIDRAAGISELRLSRPYHDIPLYMPDGTRIE